MSVQDAFRKPVAEHAFPPLAEFAEEVFGQLPRVDQRRWARAYLNGLLTVPGKKTLQRLARAVSASPVAANGLQQFINSSPWEWRPPRAALARAAAQRVPVRAWTVGTSVIPKRGEHSVGVHRRFVRHTGRTLNCQVALGLFASSDQVSLPVDWRILLGCDWLSDEQRRRRARIPDTVRPQREWAHLLGFVDRVLADRALPAAPLVTDLGTVPDTLPLVAGLLRRGVDFAVEVSSGLPLLPVGPALPVAPARPPAVPRPRGATRPARELPTQGHIVTTAGPDGRPRQLAVHSALVQLPLANEARPVLRLFAERGGPAGELRFWLTNLVDRRITDLLALTAHAARTGAAISALEDGFGVRDFEGRSYPGWHHHMTMVSAAYTYRSLHVDELAAAPLPFASVSM
jgi:hypothetical protein